MFSWKVWRRPLWRAWLTQGQFTIGSMLAWQKRLVLALSTLMKYVNLLPVDEYILVA
jgi:hypothetical protein